jgi:transposase
MFHSELDPCQPANLRQRSAAHLHRKRVPLPLGSGGHTRFGALTKQGDPDARWMLIEAATHAMRHQPFARLYQRVKARQGTPAARVAVARRLVHLSHCILKEARPFVPEAQWSGRPRGVMVQ